MRLVIEEGTYQVGYGWTRCSPRSCKPWRRPVTCTSGGAVAAAEGGGGGGVDGRGSGAWADGRGARQDCRVGQWCPGDEYR